MPKSPDHRTSAGAWDGALPMTISSGYLAFVTTANVSNNGAVVAPCNLTIVGAYMHVDVIPSATAPKVNIGTATDPDGILSSYDIVGNSTAIGFRDLTSLLATGFAATAITKGEIVQFQLVAATATGGNVTTTLVCMPTSGQA